MSKRKPKFRVGQVVAIVSVDMAHPLKRKWSYRRIVGIKFLLNEWSYRVEGRQMLVSESWMRPLTKREKGESR